MKDSTQHGRNQRARGTCIAAVVVAVALTSCGGDQSVSSHPENVAVRMPMIVAHRGGAADAPENTLDAIKLAMRNKADAIWISVQLSKDGIPVLYRPAKLIDQTGERGVVADYDSVELGRMNAGENFKDATGRYPYRSDPVGIPTLRSALRVIPSDMPVMLDMKALPAEPLARAVASVLSEEEAWSRVTIYSTDADYQRAFSAYPNARLFESRDTTRDRLTKVLLNEGCENVLAGPEWTAFEMHRNLTVTERFTLGEGRSDVRATMWTRETVACFRKRAGVKILAIAVNGMDDYRNAACLGIDAVLTDSPEALAEIRNRAKSMACSW